MAICYLYSSYGKKKALFKSTKKHQLSVLSPERIYWRKGKGCTQCTKTWQATCALWPVCQGGGAFVEEKWKFRKREAGTIELYYKHSPSCRVLPCGALLMLNSTRAATSPGSPRGPSPQRMFAYSFP